MYIVQSRLRAQYVIACINSNCKSDYVSLGRIKLMAMYAKYNSIDYIHSQLWKLRDYGPRSELTGIACVRLIRRQPPHVTLFWPLVLFIFSSVIFNSVNVHVQYTPRFTFSIPWMFDLKTSSRHFNPPKSYFYCDVVFLKDEIVTELNKCLNIQAIMIL